MKPVSLTDAVVIEHIDLADAADKIRPKNSALADLLDAVNDVDADETHTVVEYSADESECADDCSPCIAKYAAQTVAAAYLRAFAKAGAR